MRLPFLFVVLTTLYLTGSYSQNADASLYELFDQTAGRKNLGLHNGTIHNNIYRSSDATHRYYGTGKYLLGDVVYDGQPYSGIFLKYDLLTDVLVVKLEGENNNMGFNLIPEKTESFYLDNKKFANLSLKKAPDFAKGFYEETKQPQLTLYTKYHKDRIEVLTNSSVFNKYYDKNDFVIHYENTWHRADSERDITAIFPLFKDKITDYYAMNASLEKSDKRQFMKNLAKYINDFLINPLNK